MSKVPTNDIFPFSAIIAISVHQCFIEEEKIPGFIENAYMQTEE